MAEASQRSIRRPKRWDQPFGPDLTNADVERILAMAPFDGMDQSRFGPSATLRDIIRNDARLLTFESGDLIVRAGDHGTSTFFIIAGTVRVVLPPGLPNTLLGRVQKQRKTVWQALAQVWSRPKAPEVRDIAKLDPETATNIHITADGETRTRLKNIQDVCSRYKTVVLSETEMFGEIAALTRAPRTTTIFAEGQVELLEIRRPGIRDIRDRVASFKEHIDGLYRQRSLEAHLRESWVFKHLDSETMNLIVRLTLFETYGNFDWQASFMRVAEGTPAERLEKEPVIAREGEYPDGLLMVRAGFSRVSHEQDYGHKTTSYLGSGAIFGLEELLHNWRGEGEPAQLQSSLRAVGYTDILRVPTHIIEQYVLPQLPADQPAMAIERRDRTEPAMTAEPMPAASAVTASTGLAPDVVEFLVDNRHINGSQTMLIDLDRCVRCDACSEACAVGHNNNPRFNRHGRRIQSLMVANACMHCADPVCMLGCPTGAIHRVEGSGEVVVNDDTCIGCGTCANNCPYDNIRMVEVRDAEGRFIFDEITGQPVTKSTKCDLCVDQIGGPACQRACPHDALVRMDMSDTASLAKWLDR